MLTKYEQELSNYWKNWKPGMGPYGKTKREEIEIKVEVKTEEVRLDRLAEDIGDRIWDII